MKNIKNFVGLKSVVALCVSLHANGLNAAICNSDLPQTTPTSRYQLNGDGTATDLETGLMWDRCALGMTFDSVNQTCTGTAFSRTWRQATQSGPDSSVGGYTDWRLPNIKELQTIIELQCFRPALNETVFPDDTLLVSFHNYWSSTPNVAFPERAWMVRVDSGYVRPDIMSKDIQHEVRLVRDAQ